MKTFRELLAEAAHDFGDSVSAWGIITKDGIISGNHHHIATTHNQLAAYTGNHISQCAEYFIDHTSEPICLSIRTKGGESVNNTIRYFDQLPHTKFGDCSHDHELPKTMGFGLSKLGKRHEILHRLRSIAKAETSSITEAQHGFESHYGQWGIATKDGLIDAPIIQRQPITETSQNRLGI